MTKRNSVASWTVDAEAGSLTVEFPSGNKRTVRIVDLDPMMVTRLALHGLRQKAGDSYAGAKEAVESGQAEDVESFVEESATAVIDNILAGVWAERATGDGGDLARALAEVTGKPRADVAAKLRTMSDEEKKKARSHPRVKALIAEYRLEREKRKAEALRAGADDEAAVPGFED